mgnify:CR=1 FL=1
MKGKELKIKEVLELTDGTNVWVEDIRGVYRDEVNIKRGVELFPKNGVSWSLQSRDIGRIRVYEWYEKIALKEYRGWEILKMIDEGELEPGDKVLADNEFEFYVSNTGTLRYSSGRAEVGASYFNKIKYTLVIRKLVEVSFTEAIKAYSEGKTIISKGYKTYTYEPNDEYEDFEQMKSVESAGLSAKEILESKWFIKD